MEAAAISDQAPAAVVPSAIRESHLHFDRVARVWRLPGDVPEDGFPQRPDVRPSERRPA